MVGVRNHKIMEKKEERKILKNSYQMGRAGCSSFSVGYLPLL
jgi:hypothetical protein